MAYSKDSTGKAGFRSRNPGRKTGGYKARGTSIKDPDGTKYSSNTAKYRKYATTNPSGHNAKGASLNDPDGVKYRKEHPRNARGGHEPRGADTRNPMVRDDKPSMATLASQIRHSPTPSKRPDEQGSTVRTGRERANHKYIEKRKTKSGKIRYIYDIDTASGRKRDANSIHFNNKNKREQALRRVQQNRDSRRRQKEIRDNQPINKAKRALKSAGDFVSSLASKTVKAASGAIKTGRSWLNKTFGI